MDGSCACKFGFGGPEQLQLIREINSLIKKVSGILCILEKEKNTKLKNCTFLMATSVSAKIMDHQDNTDKLTTLQI